MPPTIHCVRHGQGVHNLSHDNHDMPDPSLTTLGEEQSRELAEKHGGVFEGAELILASPLRRTISTALLAFKSILDGGRKVVAWPELQEASDLPCDTGSDVAKLQVEFDSSPVDLTLAVPGWEVKTAQSAANSTSLLARAANARAWLARRPEKEVVLVSHGCFLHFLTDDWVDSTCSHMTSWKHTELRSYNFVDGGEHGLYLQETPESRERRGLSPLEPTLAERFRLRDISIQNWIKCGVIS
ncbi:Histidine phosphatase clade-1 [Cordyceps militaris]|uniref:Histidine phosphatase clade-1 n=1 Tax=Cordyceps militaris TaxID=73501 RepID=A0A2H4SLH9_CORMI|nr:Histidine phosphatase clade-1 [Cordyceps militaris]